MLHRVFALLFLAAAACAEPADLSGPELERDAVRLLHQATFGPDQTSVNEVLQHIATAAGKPLAELRRDGASDAERRAGMAAWIDEQFGLQPTPRVALLNFLNQWEYQAHGEPRSTGPNTFNRTIMGAQHSRHIWFTIALQSRDQLRQRLAHAFSEIFVVSIQDARLRTAFVGMNTYHEMLASHADGHFEELLADISLSPVMGQYLSHRRNEAVYSNDVLVVYPDENYAREIMQLFSIGLTELEPDGTPKTKGTEPGPDGKPVPRPLETYSNEDIKAVARVFTGYNFSKISSQNRVNTPADQEATFDTPIGNGGSQARWALPMRLYPKHHDWGAKTILGVEYPPEQPTADGRSPHFLRLHKQLASHPNTGPFLGRRLIQHLVTSNPSPAYLERVSRAYQTANHAGEADLAAMVKAILLDPEARNLNPSPTFGKKREPLLMLTAMARSLEPRFDLKFSMCDTSMAHTIKHQELSATLRHPAEGEPGICRSYSFGRDLGQDIWDAPSVFNWFTPDFKAGGSAHEAAGLVAPELEMFDGLRIMRSLNFLGIYGASGAFGGSSFKMPKAGTNWLTRKNVADIEIPIREVAEGETVEYHPTTTVFLTHRSRLEGSRLHRLLTESGDEALLDHLDLMFTAGRLATKAHASDRTIILETMAAEKNELIRIRLAVALLVQSPAFQVQT